MVNMEEGKAMDKPDTTSMPTSASYFQAGNGHISEYQATLSMLLMNPQDFSVEEMAKYLHMVMNENMDLKETVAQNNLGMRHQLSLLEQWNLQVESDKENSKSIIEECKRQIIFLETENQLLKKTLTASQNESQCAQFKELDATIQSQNDGIEKMQLNLRKAQEDKETLRSIRLKVEGENTVLKCSLATARSELEKIQLERHEFVNMIKNLRDKAGKEDTTNEMMASDVKYPKLPVTSDSISQELLYKNQCENLEKQLQLCRGEAEKYKALHAESSNYQDAASLTTVSTTMNKNLDDPEKRMLQDEITNLNEQISYLGSVSDEKKQTRAAADSSDVGKWQREIIRLNNLLKDVQEKADRNLYTDQYYQVKIKSINEQHDEATAKIISYEELLSTKNDEILRLKKDLGKTRGQLTEVHSEKDIVAVLRAQVEVYQADFRAEREAREALASDREKLRDEMKQCQARNTQLIDELEAYHRRTVPQNRGSRATSEEPKFEATNADFSWEKISIVEKKEEEPTTVEEIDENLLYCPKCNVTFAELGPLEQHVNRCLDED